MPEPVPVRRVRAGEALKVRAIRLEALGDPAAGIAFLETRAQADARPAAFWQERAAAAALSEATAQFIAEAGRDWVGTLTVLRPEPGSIDYFGRPARAGRALVVAVYVRPSHRGGGAIDALMHAAAQWAIAAGERELQLDVHQDNPRARHAYERLGFVATGRSSVGPNGVEVEMVRGL